MLHNDIVTFSEKLRETPIEMHNRELAVARLEAVLARVDPKARIHTFGSSATGLRLPYGDVDLMIETRMIDRSVLIKRLRRSLIDANVAGKILALPKARVPIVKWVDRETGVQLDACFNHVDGLVTTAALARAASTTPELRPLVLVLKSQLIMHGLNETVNGGVGGYLLANMVRHVLALPPAHAQIHSSDSHIAHDSEAEHTPEEPEDLGGMLLRFYWYYGYKLDLSSSIVMSERGGAGVICRPGTKGYMAHDHDQLSLSDPARPGNDLGAKAFRFQTVRRLLRLTYTKAIDQIARRDSIGAKAAPILSTIIPTWSRGDRYTRGGARKGQKALLQMQNRRKKEEAQFEEHIRAAGEGHAATATAEFGDAGDREPFVNTTESMPLVSDPLWSAALRDRS